MNVDWALLRAQKALLLHLVEHDERFAGLIHSIDAFQDWSVDNGNATEEEVFGGAHRERLLQEALEVMKALGDAYDVGQRASDTSAIGRYRSLMKKLEN